MGKVKCLMNMCSSPMLSLLHHKIFPNIMCQIIIAKTFLLTQKHIMSDIRNVSFLRFCDVTKQNGRGSMGTLYKEPLGEIVVHCDNVYKIEKGPR